jgi:predicted DNA binding CopG/RHH family protein
MAAKKVSIGAKPTSPVVPNIDQWVETRTVEPELPVEETKPKMKRLTLDIPETLHRTIKLRAVEQGVPMADLLRELLEKHYL